MANDNSWGGFFGDANSQRADDAEAMWIGTAFGAAKAVKNIRAEHEAELEAITHHLELAVGNQIALGADRDAHKQLTEAIVGELKHPEQERRFSVPENDLARGRLLQEAHRHSFEATLERVKAAGNTSATPRALQQARERGDKALAGYRDDAYAAQIATRARNKP